MKITVENDKGEPLGTVHYPDPVEPPPAFDFGAALEASFSVASDKLPETDVAELRAGVTEEQSERILIELVEGVHYTLGLHAGRAEAKPRAPRRVFPTTLKDDMREQLSDFLGGTSLTAAVDALHDKLKARYDDDEGETPEPGARKTIPYHHKDRLTSKYVKGMTVPQAIMEGYVEGGALSMATAERLVREMGYNVSSTTPALSWLTRHGYLTKVDDAWLYAMPVAPKDAPLKWGTYNSPSPTERAILDERQAILDLLKELGAVTSRDYAKGIISKRAATLGELKPMHFAEVKEELESALYWVKNPPKPSGFLTDRERHLAPIIKGIMAHYREGGQYTLKMAKRWYPAASDRKIKEAVQLLIGEKVLKAVGPNGGHENDNLFIFAKPLPEGWGG